ncbi:MAG TPA: MmgE/PrpD family protein [Ramlibacter sp.]|nr:MmgE/PrpD family protein [Ramlibacter sp.]
MREDVTRALAEFALADAAALPPAVRDQARRAFTNYVGCTLGGVQEPASVHVRSLGDEFSGPRTATVLGTRLRLDPLHAALANGVQSSIQTFDDTHLSSVIHPTGPVAAALMALLEHRPQIACDGSGFLAALAYGVEVSCRVAVVLTTPPAQPHLGLFMTGITGGAGAAAACARVLGLDAQRAAWAIGTAAAQAGGLRATHTTMAAGLVPALGGRAGLEAALLAQKGFDGSPATLEHRNGLFAVLAPGSDAQLALHGLGTRFELQDLSYKPYPCGVVIHPSVDAVLDLVPQVQGQALESVQLRVHPLTLQLTGTRHPAHALSCNASVYHWTAAALVRGRAGLAEATEQALHDPAIAALRERIQAQADDTLARDESIAIVRLADGRTLRSHVAHARGSRDRPLTEAELAGKVRALTAPVIGDSAAMRLLGLCQAVPQAAAGWLPELAACCTPT